MELRFPAATGRIQERIGGSKSRGGSLLLLLLALPMLALLIVPLLSLLARVRVRLLIENLRTTEVIQAVSLSLLTSATSTAAAIVMGVPLAYLLARRSFRGHGIVDTLVDLPMVLPPAVAGIALLMAFGRRGLLGQYLDMVGFNLAFTTAAVILAQIFVAAPFFIKAAVAGFGGVERELEQAAEMDGASRWRVFRYITTPLAWPVLLGGAVMTWARALGEFGATIIFAGNFPGRTQTMPLAIYIGLELELGTALTLSVILLGISFLVLFLVKGVLRQRLGSG